MAGVPFDRHRAVVLPEWIDYNGHMNVDYYLLAFDQATDLFFDHLGLGAAHRAATGGSTFAGDIHLTYRRELREGDPLRVKIGRAACRERGGQYVWISVVAVSLKKKKKQKHKLPVIT